MVSIESRPEGTIAVQLEAADMPVMCRDLEAVDALLRERREASIVQRLRQMFPLHHMPQTA